jgi:hypothetical protein
MLDDNIPSLNSSSYTGSLDAFMVDIFFTVFVTFSLDPFVIDELVHKAFHFLNIFIFKFCIHLKEKLHQNQNSILYLTVKRDYYQ